MDKLNQLLTTADYCISCLKRSTKMQMSNEDWEDFSSIAKHRVYKKSNLIDTEKSQVGYIKRLITNCYINYLRDNFFGDKNVKGNKIYKYRILRPDHFFKEKNDGIYAISKNILEIQDFKDLSVYKKFDLNDFIDSLTDEEKSIVSNRLDGNKKHSYYKILKIRKKYTEFFELPQKSFAKNVG